jgi:folylpolyglutamate synthase/dihydrofolate synthase
MTFGMALDYFAKQAVDVAVIEVGLGGRLDSTNIIKPELSVITNIGLDHVAILGDTLPKIAYEKAGIIKQNTPVVIGEKQEEVIAVFTDKAKEETAPLVIASDATTNPKTDLLGIYQKKNAKTAYVALQELAKQQHFKILESDIKRGLTNVTKNTGLKGRWQVLQNKPFVVADTAHNKEGLTLVLAQLQTYTYNSLHIVLGLVSDKNTDDILQLFPKDATYYFCKPNVPRGLSETVLQDEAKKNGLKR